MVGLEETRGERLERKTWATVVRCVGHGEKFGFLLNATGNH